MFFLVAAGAIEAYLSPALMKSVVSMLLNNMNRLKKFLYLTRNVF